MYQTPSFAATIRLPEPKSMEIAIVKIIDFFGYRRDSLIISYGSGEEFPYLPRGPASISAI